MKKIITQDLNNAPESKEILETASKTFAGSKKIYIEGSKPEIKVPMREILQTDSLTAEGKQKNKPLYVYDTSGPYTDPEVEIDIEFGIPKNRLSWLSRREENSTQMSLARKGIITEEMEYIAIRENQNLEKNSKLKEGRFHTGENFGANIPGLGIILTIILIYILGVLVTNFLGRKIFNFGEKVVKKVPVVNRRVS